MPSLTAKPSERAEEEMRKSTSATLDWVGSGFGYSRERTPAGASRPFPKESVIALAALLGIAAHLGLRYLGESSHLTYDTPLFAVLLLGGAPLVYDLFLEVARKQFGADLPARISIVTSALVQCPSMGETLHITNGDAVQLAQTGLGGDLITWKDALHEGPVPQGLSLDELRPVRARFLAGLDDRQASEVDAALRERDQALASFRDRQEVVLWFEHDLYDQLQLIQILDWFSAQDLDGMRLSLIAAREYLGRLTPQELAALYPTRRPVTEAELGLARRVWGAFRSPSPTELVELMRADTSTLPFLHGALLRHLEQFPSAANGLSRSERQILEIAADGASSVGAIFRASSEREQSVFLGDLIFVAYVRGLVRTKVPLLRIVKQADPPVRTEVEITPEGRAVLGGDADHVRVNGIDRWLGGVHLRSGHVWRWDSAAQRVIFNP